ncbi:hypothetical protein, partial [Sideroxydans sp. CL21]
GCLPVVSCCHSFANIPSNRRSCPLRTDNFSFGTAVALL